MKLRTFLQRYARDDEQVFHTLKVAAWALAIASFIGTTASVITAVLLFTALFARRYVTQPKPRRRIAMGRDTRGRFAVAQEPTAADYQAAYDELEELVRSHQNDEHTRSGRR